MSNFNKILNILPFNKINLNDICWPASSSLPEYGQKSEVSHHKDMKLVQTMGGSVVLFLLPIPWGEHSSHSYISNLSFHLN